MAALVSAIGRALVERLRRKSDDEPHIAVLCDWLLRYGSAQAAGLRRAGVRVTLYYVDRLGEFGGKYEDREAFLEEARAAGVDVVQVPMRSPKTLARDVRWLLRDLQARNVTFLLAQSHYDPRWAAVSLRLPVALVLHDPRPHSGEEKNLPLVGRTMARIVEATASCIVIHSELLRGQLRPFLAHQKVAVAPHGTDVSEAPAAPPAAKRLLLLGRMFPYKGVEVAVQAFARVRELRPDVSLTIAGRGPSADALEGRVPDGVRLVNRYVTDAEVDQLIDEETLMLLPYLDATQSGVGLLALGHGLPCVVTREGGLPDLVPDGHPEMIVGAGDPGALASAVVAQLDHGPALREAVLEHARRSFSWDAAEQKLLAELARLGLVPPAGPHSSPA